MDDADGSDAERSDLYDVFKLNKILCTGIICALFKSCQAMLFCISFLDVYKRQAFGRCEK